jgi:hypothetical protein
MPDTSRSIPAILTDKTLQIGTLLLVCGLGHAETCTVSSANHSSALLELYSSEGCDSCPSTDKWLSSLAAKGLSPTRVVPLAFHVDYWDRLGWKDPFAKNQFTLRQQQEASSDKAGFIYTPQLRLNGRDYRRTGQDEEFLKSLAVINGSLPPVTIELTLRQIVSSTLQTRVELHWKQKRPTESEFFLALYENNLRSVVKAGENSGRVLQHDFIVRALAGPFDADQSSQSFKLDPSWQAGNLGVAAFVQERDTSEVLQAVATPLCGLPPPR